MTIKGYKKHFVILKGIGSDYIEEAYLVLKKEMPRGKFDYVFADLWHDASDGLEMYRKLKKYEILAPSTEFDYWIEPSLLSLLRHIVYRRITDENEPLNLGGLSPETVLTDDFLRKLQ